MPRNHWPRKSLRLWEFKNFNKPSINFQGKQKQDTDETAVKLENIHTHSKVTRNSEERGDFKNKKLFKGMKVNWKLIFGR